MGAVHLTVASPGFMTLLGVKEIDMFSLLYLFDSFDHWEACVDGRFGQDMNRLLAEKTDDRFRIMGYWTSSVRDYYGKKAVTAPGDLKGMTIRTQSTPVVQEFFKSCGAIPTSVAWGELYQALSQGVVDSAENDYTSFRLKEHHKTENGRYISETHHDYTTRLFLTTGQFYNALTEEQRGGLTRPAALPLRKTAGSPMTCLRNPRKRSWRMGRRSLISRTWILMRLRQSPSLSRTGLLLKTIWRIIWQ